MRTYSYFLKGKFIATHLHFGEILHGHNFKCIVKFNLEKTDLLKEKFNSVIEKIHYVHLNQLDFFKNNSPSTENIAIYISEQLEKENCFHKSVEVFETDDASGGLIKC